MSVDEPPRVELDLADVTVILDLAEHGRVEVSWPRFTRGEDVYEYAGLGEHPDWVKAAIAELGLDRVDDDVRRRALEGD